MITPAKTLWKNVNKFTFLTYLVISLNRSILYNVADLFINKFIEMAKLGTVEKGGGGITPSCLHDSVKRFTHAIFCALFCRARALKKDCKSKIAKIFRDLCAKHVRNLMQLGGDF